jgi:hypothetical protein
MRVPFYESTFIHFGCLYKMSDRILAHIDAECDRIHGRIITRDSNLWLNLRDHRRWMHPLWETYLKLKEEEIKRLNPKEENE